LTEHGNLEPGTEIDSGRYRIQEIIGEGSMGRVYRAYDRRLRTDVVLKFPLPPGADLRGSDLLERFEREIRSLVALSHPHVVRVLDAGDLDGNPFVVLQYLAGGSLRDRLNRHADASYSAMLRSWLPDIARALDFVHSQGFIHRDVKPANIFFDAHGNAFLGDFGIIKALSSNQPAEDASGSSLTRPGYVVGTPNYIAPEIVMGREADGRSDQYSLALMLHEILTGENVMVGPSPSATLVNQTKIEPPPIIERIPSMPLRLSEALSKALSKDPANRFPNCAIMAREVLADLPGADVDFDETGFSFGPDPSGRTSTLEQPRPSELISPGDSKSNAPIVSSKPPLVPRRRALLVAGGTLATATVLGGGAWLATRGRSGGPGGDQRSAARPVLGTAPPKVEINLAYGTEKSRWLETARDAFYETDDGRRISVNLLPRGSVEGAREILEGPAGKPPIHVWSPASSAYLGVFARDWTSAHGGNPIAEARDLVLTPMVFVMWATRYEAFLKKYGSLDFRTLGEAMAEPRGWESIADRPEWGSAFNFGHTDPSSSNSGLLTLVLLAYKYSNKQRSLKLADVQKPEFQTWLNQFEKGVVGRGRSFSSSTGKLMDGMIQRGPTDYDCLLVYENLAVDSMPRARGRWREAGQLQVVYPDPNIWNENPYYILNVPWSGDAERDAAARFLTFLMSPPIQRRALDYGFRPGDLSVPVDSSESPLVKASEFGIRIDLPPMCEPPSADVVSALLELVPKTEA
jgi:serine/threonine protein kinase